MGRVLDTPVPRGSLAFQCIQGIRFEIPHLWDGTKMALAKNSIYVTYTVENYNEFGEKIGGRQETVKFPDWSAGFISDANAVYNKCELDATNKGLIGQGTTETI